MGIITRIFVSLLMCMTVLYSGTASHGENYAGSVEHIRPVRILVLNSYHYGFTWTDLVMRGITDTFKKSNVPVSLQVEYLDAKRFPAARVKESIRALLSLKISDNPIRVVITSDNIALETAIALRPDMFPDAAIVFCGFNGNPDAVTAGRRNVTGILEKWNPRGTLQAIEQLQSDVKEIVVIHDQTESGLGTREDLLDVIDTYRERFNFRFITGMRIENIFDDISHLGTDSAVLLLGYNMDSVGKVFDSADTGRIFASHSSVPVYTMDETRFNGGVVGGRLLTGEHQGVVAAEMALKILSGQSADSIPIIRNDPGVFIFSYEALNRYDLRLSRLPAGSIVRNQPESFYYKYRIQVYALTVVFIMLILFILILTYNIIKRVRSEEDRKRLVSAIEEADDVFCFSSVDERIIYMNAAGTKLLGWSLEDAINGKRHLSEIHPDRITAETKDTINEELKRTGKWSGESVIRAKDGGDIPVSQVIMLHKDNEGNPLYFSTIMRNITEHKKSEASLREKEENLRITLDSIGDAVLATDEKGIVWRMNPAAERLIDCTQNEAIGKPLSDVFSIVSAINEGVMINPVEEVIQSGGIVYHQDRLSVLQRRDGTRRMISDSAAPIRNSADRIVGVVLVFHDRTEEYELQEQLRQSQRMEVIGQLAGGVAHDFNNILAVILGSAQLLESSFENDSEDCVLAGDIVNAAVRASELTRQLLAFSRKGPMQMASVNIHKIIEEVIRLLNRSIGKSIRITAHLNARKDIIRGDPSLLQSTILNLAVNARDAMSAGGELTFDTSIVTLDDVYCHTEGRDLKPGEYLQLAVIDTGEGMSESVLSRLFEPYFTTKPEGKGTGLGLAAVYGCVKSHKGSIKVYSEPGRGTTFTLLFPLLAVHHVDTAGNTTGLVYGGGTILIVDDDDIVRNMTVKALQSLGYTVIPVSDGYEAAKRLKEMNDEIKLVILDLLMPVISGKDTFYMLKEIDEDIRIIICSGFIKHEVIDELMKSGARGFLSKPFRIDELSRMIGSVAGDSAEKSYADA